MTRNKKSTLILCLIGAGGFLTWMLAARGDVSWLGAIPGYTAAGLVVAGFVHGWRSAKKFLILAGGSVVCFVVGAVLHNVLYGLGELAADIAVVHYGCEFLHVAFFIVAVFFCPAGFLVGVGGGIVMYIRGRRLAAGGSEQGDGGE
jgi:hypothetical protein